MTERTLDRRVHYDERSRAYPIRTLLPPRRPRGYSWRCTVVLDQGSEGACVGFGWAGELAARPAVWAGIDNAMARSLYRRAQLLDDWAGEDYSGSSVLAGAKAVTELRGMSEYRWAFGLADVVDALAWHGPVVLGVQWREGMYAPRGDELELAGAVVGGHCILANAVDVKGQRVRLHNSWGAGWGHAGEAWLSWDALSELLADQGEACVPVRRLAAPRV